MYIFRGDQQVPKRRCRNNVVITIGKSQNFDLFSSRECIKLYVFFARPSENELIFGVCTRRSRVLLATTMMCTYIILSSGCVYSTIGGGKKNYTLVYDILYSRPPFHSLYELLESRRVVNEKEMKFY